MTKHPKKKQKPSLSITIVDKPKRGGGGSSPPGGQPVNPIKETPGSGFFIKGKEVSIRDFRILRDRNITKERRREFERKKRETTENKQVLKPTQETEVLENKQKFTPEQQAIIDESPFETIKRGAPESIGQLAGDIATVSTFGAAGLIGIGAKTGTKVVTSVDEILVGFSNVGKTIAKRQQIGKRTPELAKLFDKSGPLNARITASRYADNLKTQGLSRNLITKVALQFKKPPFIAAAIYGMVGNYAWAEWAQGEAVEILGFTSTRAIESGDPLIIREFQEAREEILDKNVWETLARLTPGISIAAGFLNKWKALKAQVKVNLANENKAIEQLATGETEFQSQTREREIDKQELGIRRSEVFELRRQDRHLEADELDLQILNDLKGGVTNE